MAPAHVLERLREADWETTYEALTAYAVTRTNRLYLVRGGGQLPEGHEAEDVVNEAVRLVFEGKRRWNPEEQPDLVRYLSGVVSSLISNLVTGADHTRRAGDVDEPTDIDRYEDAASPSPLTLAASGECVEALRTIVDRETKDDDGLASVAMGLEDGMTPAEIAELLSMEVNEVYRLARKLRRRLHSAMGGHECWEDHPVMATASRP